MTLLTAPSPNVLPLLLHGQGLDQLLEQNRTADLTLIYSLFSRVKDGLSHLCTYFARFIKLTGKCIVVNPEKDPVMVQELLDFKVRKYLLNLLYCDFWQLLTFFS